ncbi:MAG: hypothetical protein HC869_04280 [Rhodospirillales bacterium]|nr:hypothetical protein [Rhodospirillales bacterium]
MDKNTTDILEALDFIKERMATKDDVTERLDLIEENLKGVTKEIDEIRTEVREIQKHLGIERKIAA